MDSFFTQRVKVNIENNNINRFKFFEKICKNKKVLHIGFVDYPITNADQNMHIILDKVCTELVGIDPNISHFKDLSKNLKNKRMYATCQEISEEYFDLVIVPEVIEHVDNVKDFLEEISELNFGHIYITAPDAFLLRNNVTYNRATGEVTEIVHPDHNCWFSPYTLKNVVDKYTNLNVEQMLYVGNNSIVGVFKK